MTSTDGQPGAPAPGLLGLRDTAQRLLEAANALPSGWAVRGLKRVGPASIKLDLGPPAGRGLLIEWHELIGDEPVPAMVTGPQHAAGYCNGPDAWTFDDEDAPEDVRRAALLTCEALAHPREAVSLAAQAAAHEDEQPAIDFAAPAFEGWLASALARGQSLGSTGFRLDDVHPFGPEELALVFDHPDAAGLRMKVRLRDDERPAAFRTRHLDVLYRVPFGRAVDADRNALMERLANELSLVLDALDQGAGFIAPRREEADPNAGPPPALNLALQAPCGLKCAFCSVREEIEPFAEADDAYLDALRQDIVRAGARGTDTLRINGLEPLNAPFLFELLELARESGFTTFHLLSTCLPLDDPAFCARVLDAMPERYRIYAPIYGASPAVHDPLVGCDGAFDRLMTAVDNIRAQLDERGELIFTTILMRGNAEDVPAMSALVNPLGRWWEVHLPFPNTSSARDRYRDVALRMRDAVAAVYPAGGPPQADLVLGEVPICIAFDHQRATGHRLVTLERLRRRQRELSGTFYETIGFTHSLGEGEAVAFTAATTPCPHREGCAAVSVCPAKTYTAYAEEFGLDELRPIARAELEELADGAAIIAYLEHRID